MRLNIYLFRHGQTSYNRDGKFTGLHNPGLTKKGIQNARTVSLSLKKKKFQVAFHTHLKRSKQTLNEVLKYHPECTEVFEDDRMIERNYGSLNGTTHRDFIKKIGAKIYDLEVHGDIAFSIDGKARKEMEKYLGEAEYNLIHRGYNVPPPNGESFAMVEKRVSKFIKDLKNFMKKNKVSVAISAHGNSIRLFRKIMEKASIEDACSWVIPYDKVFRYTLNV